MYKCKDSTQPGTALAVKLYVHGDATDEARLVNEIRANTLLAGEPDPTTGEESVVPGEAPHCLLFTTRGAEYKVQDVRDHDGKAPKPYWRAIMPFAHGGSIYPCLKAAKHKYAPRNAHGVPTGFHGLPIPVVRYYGRQLCEALVGMHRRGVAHGDVKYQNVLLDRQENLLLHDFGHAHIWKTPGGHMKELPILKRRGTDVYNPPELWKGSHSSPYDTLAVDSWCFGVTVFSFAVGWSPFYDQEKSRKMLMQPGGVWHFLTALSEVFPCLLPEAGEGGMLRMIEGLWNPSPEHRTTL